jgi:hypothetical protein
MLVQRLNDQHPDDHATPTACFDPVSLSASQCEIVLAKAKVQISSAEAPLSSIAINTAFRNPGVLEI